MKKSLLIVGLGDFGSTVAIEFSRLGYDVLGVDISEKRVQELSDAVTKVVQGDATSPGLWKDLPIKQIEIAVIAFSSNRGDSLQAALLLKKAGIKMIVAKSESDLHTELLTAVGVDWVINTDKESALRTIHILGSGIEDYIEVTREFGVARIRGNKVLNGITTGSLYDKYNAWVAVLQRGERLILQPPDTEKIEHDDILIVAGTDQDLRSIPGVNHPQGKDEGAA